MSSDRGDRLSLVGAAIALLWGCAKINWNSVLLLQRAIAQNEFWTFPSSAATRSTFAKFPVMLAIVNQKALCGFNSFTITFSALLPF